MKPPAFAYRRPANVAEAVAELAEAGTDGKVLAGGQSLVPILNMRLAQPATLVDINGLGAELGFVTVDDQVVRVGALARHARLERDEAAFAVLPLLREATQHVAHPTIRNRGTTVGSLVHADPAAEMPAVLLLCDGEVELASLAVPGSLATAGLASSLLALAGAASAGGGSAGGSPAAVDGVVSRRVAAGEFFLGPLESAVRPGELAVAASFRRPPPGTGTAWVEVSRRAGDYALCGLGLTVTLDADLRVSAARAAYISVATTPILVDLTEAVIGQPHDLVDWATAGALAQSRVEPDDDIHASAAYRRHLVGVLTVRAGRRAAERAASASNASASSATEVS